MLAKECLRNEEPKLIWAECALARKATKPRCVCDVFLFLLPFITVHTKRIIALLMGCGASTAVVETFPSPAVSPGVYPSELGLVAVVPLVEGTDDDAADASPLSLQSVSAGSAHTLPHFDVLLGTDAISPTPGCPTVAGIDG